MLVICLAMTHNGSGMGDTMEELAKQVKEDILQCPADRFGIRI